MCMICVEFQSKKMSPIEALKNVTEMKDKIGEEHAKEVVKMLFSDAIRNRRKPKSEEFEAEEDWKFGSD